MDNMTIIWIAVGVTVGLLFLIILATFVFKGKKRPANNSSSEQSLKIDLSKMDASGPDSNLAQLDFYSTPVRLAILVVAPKGHSVQVPNQEQLQVLVERICPGLGTVIQQHQPRICIWPAQLSHEGFVNALFHNIQLPGSEGRGTPWSGVAGQVTVGMGTILIGLICVADSGNQMGPVSIEHEGQWRDVIRTR